MNEFMGNIISKTIGSVMECDVCPDGMRWGEVLKVLIELDIYQPISRGQTINLYGVSLWIPFTYKNLTRLCFRCGRISYDSTFYEKGGKKLNTRSKKFKVWLRADRKKSHIGSTGGAPSWNSPLKTSMSRDVETEASTEDEPRKGIENAKDIPSGDGMANKK